MARRIVDRQRSSVFYSGNAEYLERLRKQFQQEGSSLPASWQDFFASEAAASSGATTPSGDTAAQFAVANLIDAYRNWGSRDSKLDPLQIEDRACHPALELATWGLGEKDMQSKFATDLPGLQHATLEQIITRLQQLYCGTLTAEYMYSSDLEVIKWFQQNYETLPKSSTSSAEEKKFLLSRLVAADTLERYLNTRFTGQKRFSLEGGDALIPGLDILLQAALDLKMEETVIAMAHRGRLNVLINILGKSPASLFEEFEGKAKYQGSGDVKYHQGFSAQLSSAKGDGSMHLALAFNPSHLEIVNPVIEGSVRARQDRRNDPMGNLVLPIVIHGDAAVAGQGVVMETIQMSQLRGYSTGGTINIVVNNQVGFTTSHRIDARSTYWCTDVAKMFDAPVIRVNGQDPEAVALAMRLALKYRGEFRSDIFIDLVCFRRHGHNEQDEPMVTQPLMYKKVKQIKVPALAYAERLVAEGVIDAAEEPRLRKEYIAKLDKGESANEFSQEAEKSRFVNWKEFSPEKNNQWDMKVDTGVKLTKLKELATKLSIVPDDFAVHSIVKNVIKVRKSMGEGETPVDWGMAENLAYASLLTEGYRVRISGQDVGRGTFFHRHAAWHDQNREDRRQPPYFPLAHLQEEQGPFSCIDSFLSEEAVLGFEYGYSTTSPNSLVIWEAQFGDFANGAQVIIDQFISSGEFKWGRLCNLIMLLPHGYEGQGPEHSSARLERYLQLCAEYNMQVCVPSTAAQIFHLIRRQLIRPIRRPLIVMSPKSLLRNKQVTCELSDLTKGVFQALLPEADAAIKPNKVQRVVVCSGKIYYDLLNERKEKSIQNVAIIRLEQLYPFPHELFKQQIKLYSKADTVVWCQEEPGNQGAYHRIIHYLRQNMASKQKFEYALRASSASTATGTAAVHRAQQAKVIQQALGITGKNK